MGFPESVNSDITRQVVGTPQASIAGQSNPLRITLFDAAGNPVSLGGAAINIDSQIDAHLGGPSTGLLDVNGQVKPSKFSTINVDSQIDSRLGGPASGLLDSTGKVKSTKLPTTNVDASIDARLGGPASGLLDSNGKVVSTKIATTVGTIINDPATGVFDVNSKYLISKMPDLVRTVTGERPLGKGELMINVMDKGAVGNGTTDDSAAFQSAIDALAAIGGGIVFVPWGRSFVLDSVLLKSNITINMYGATLLSKVYAVFICKAFGATGYGAGGKNIAIKGGRIKGSFLDGSTHSASITLNKAQRVLFEDILFQEAVVSGHPIDPGGCDGLTIRRCVFEGWKPSTDREYTEAIGIDYSIALGQDVDISTPTSYDGAPTINVVVENCRFVALSYQVNGADYPAPNPIGCHSRVKDQWIDNITFQNNYVEGGRDTSLWTDSFAGLSRGWIHFFHGRGIKILNNKFVNVSGRAGVVIGSQTIQTGILPADTANQTPVAQTITPQPATDWVVQGNRFFGFDAATTTENIISISGHTTGPTRARGIQIADNKFVDCFPASWNGTDSSAVASEAIFLNYCEDVHVKDNSANTIRTMADIRQSINVFVERNVAQKTMSDFMAFYNVDTLNLTSNVCDNHMGGFYVNNTTSATIDKNELTLSPTCTSLGRSGHISLTGSTGFVLSRNEVKGTYSPAGVAGSNLVYGFYIYGASGDGLIEGNNTISNVGTRVKHDTATGAAVRVFYKDGKEVSTKSASYTLLRIDDNRVIEANSASAIVVTIPTNATAALGLGAVIELRQMSTGAMTVAAASGVTLRSKGGLLSLGGQYSEAKLTQRAANDWVLSGTLA